MGKQFNVYERPITREQYDYLALHCQTYLISENEKMFGPVGKVEGHEWAEEEQLDYKSPESQEEEQATEVAEQSSEQWDPDDVQFVDSLDYASKQRWLKENDLPAGGSKPELRARMLEALSTAEEVEDDGDEDEDD